jgi:protein-tyrosine phosphatase
VLGWCENAGMSTGFAICVVCSGNICRSPIGEVVVRDALEQAGLTDRVSVCSAGTGSWHLGEGADHRASAVARSHGLDLREHAAAVFTPDHFAQVDLVLALDTGHLRSLQQLAPDDDSRDKVRLLRSFDPESVADEDLEVADPYYGDRRDFEITFDQVVAAAPGVVRYVSEQLAVR